MRLRLDLLLAVVVAAAPMTASRSPTTQRPPSATRPRARTSARRSTRSRTTRISPRSGPSTCCAGRSRSPPPTRRGGGGGRTPQRAGFAVSSAGSPNRAGCSFGCWVRLRPRCSRSSSRGSCARAAYRGCRTPFVAPSHVRDLDIRPESLPDDVGAAALALWQRGEQRAALALLYRGHAVAPRARSLRADSRVVDGGRVPRARSAAACRAERALRVASRRDLDRGRLRRARARRLCGAGLVRRVRRGTRPQGAAHETAERAERRSRDVRAARRSVGRRQHRMGRSRRADAAARRRCHEPVLRGTKARRDARSDERACASRSATRAAIRWSCCRRGAGTSTKRAAPSSSAGSKAAAGSSSTPRLISGTDAFEEWSGIAREREEPDLDEDPFQAPEIVDPCWTLAEGVDAPADDESRASYVACNFDYASWLETDTAPLWALERRRFLDGGAHGRRRRAP